MRSAGRGAAIALLSFLFQPLVPGWTPPLAGQVFELQAGSSSLFRAHGGSLAVHGASYNGRVGLGFDGVERELRLGLSLETPSRGLTWRLGDQFVPFILPTDLFNRSYQFPARGVGAAKETERSRLFVFGGATSTGFHTPFFQAAEAQTTTALLFYERQLGARLRLFSHNIVAQRRTSIQGLRWTPHQPLELALAGGLGSDEPFAAGSVELNAPRLELDASYGSARRAFRRLPAEGPSIAETDRENLRIRVKPHGSLSLTLSRHHYVSPTDTGPRPARSTVNGASIWLRLAGFHMNGSLHASESRFGRSRAHSVGVSRALFGRIQTGVSYFQTVPSSGTVIRTTVARFHETLSRRLSLTQLLTRSNGQTAVNWGGALTLSRLTVGVDYQTIFLPLAPAGQSQFRQVVVVNVGMPLPRNVRLNAMTNVDPLGSLQYTGYVNAFAYGSRAAGRSGGSWTQRAPRCPAPRCEWMGSSSSPTRREPSRSTSGERRTIASR